MWRRPLPRRPRREHEHCAPPCRRVFLHKRRCSGIRHPTAPPQHTHTHAWPSALPPLGRTHPHHKPPPRPSEPSRVPRSPCIPPPAPSTRGFSPLQRHLPTVPQSAQTTARLGMRGPGPPRCPPRCPAEGLRHAARRPGAIPAPACSVCGERMKGWGERSWKGGDRPRRATRSASALLFQTWLPGERKDQSLNP